VRPFGDDAEIDHLIDGASVYLRKS
jgi:hypothetical protein